MPHLNPHCRKHQQLELLPDISSSDSFDPSSDTSAEGFVDFEKLPRLKRSDYCPTCGGDLLAFKPGTRTHAARIVCFDCGRFHKWASKSLLAAAIQESQGGAQ